MPQYKCIRPFLLQGKNADGTARPVRLCEVGEVIEYDGLPSDNLEPLCKVGKARRAEAEVQFDAQRRKAALNASQQNVGLAAAIAEMVAGAVRDALAHPTKAPAKDA